jgi:hypothetical protein
MTNMDDGKYFRVNKRLARHLHEVGINLYKCLYKYLTKNGVLKD